MTTKQIKDLEAMNKRLSKDNLNLAKEIDRLNIKNNDPFGFNNAINWDKLNDPKVLKELEELFKEEEKENEEEN